MIRHPSFWVSGWGHGAGALRPLADLCGFETADYLSLAELAGRGGVPEAGRLIARADRMPIAPVWIGWSAGALLALEAAGRGGRLSGMVLLSGTPRFCASPDWPHGVPVSRVRALRTALRDLRGPAAKAAFQKQCASPDAVGEDELRIRVEDMDREGTEALVGGLDYLSGADARKSLDRIRVPVLLLHGAEDRVIPAAASEWLVSRIANADLRIFEGKGHRLPLDTPVPVAGAIREFFEGLRP
jgi:pimeloyl-[acyl-carrier protein] methyl ester esterase